MKVKFLVDYFDAGQKVFEAGREYEGDLEAFVHRGNAVEVKAKEQKKDEKKDEPKKQKKDEKKDEPKK